MATIILSHVASDKESAERMREQLVLRGHRVIGSRDAPQDTSWARSFSRLLYDADFVISVLSAEALGNAQMTVVSRLADRLEKGADVWVGPGPTPSEQRHAIDLSNWRGEARHGQWTRLLSVLEGEEGPPKPLRSARAARDVEEAGPPAPEAPESPPPSPPPEAAPAPPPVASVPPEPAAPMQRPPDAHALEPEPPSEAPVSAPPSVPPSNTAPPDHAPLDQAQAAAPAAPPEAPAAAEARPARETTPDAPVATARDDDARDAAFTLRAAISADWGRQASASEAWGRMPLLHGSSQSDGAHDGRPSDDADDPPPHTDEFEAGLDAVADDHAAAADDLGVSGPAPPGDRAWAQEDDAPGFGVARVRGRAGPAEDDRWAGDPLWPPEGARSDDGAWDGDPSEGANAGDGARPRPRLRRIEVRAGASSEEPAADPSPAAGAEMEPKTDPRARPASAKGKGGGVGLLIVALLVGYAALAAVGFSRGYVSASQTARAGEAAWRAAERADTIRDYRLWLDRFRGHPRTTEAEAALDSLREAQAGLTQRRVTAVRRAVVASRPGRELDLARVSIAVLLTERAPDAPDMSDPFDNPPPRAVASGEDPRVVGARRALRRTARAVLTGNGLAAEIWSAEFTAALRAWRGNQG